MTLSHCVTKCTLVTRDHRARMDGEIVNRIQSTLLHVSHFLIHYSVVHRTISCISLLVIRRYLRYKNSFSHSVKCLCDQFNRGLRNTKQNLNTKSRSNHQSRKWCQHWSRKVKVGVLTPPRPPHIPRSLEPEPRVDIVIRKVTGGSQAAIIVTNHNMTH